jgi:iron complex transport system substrate-binding protein
VESVLERNPQAIIAGGGGVESTLSLDSWKQWPSLTAVKNNHLFYIPPDIIHRHTVRILQGAQILCDQLQIVRESKP